ncbi:hypothetical protein Unana1_01627 [Umbelopsis nana]
MSDVQFDDLLAAATSISKEHERDLKQRAARAQKEEARKKQEEERRHKAKRDAQAAILKLREEEEKRRRSALQRQKLIKEQRETEMQQRQKQQHQQARKPVERKPAGKQPIARQNLIPEKPKMVHDIPFEEIMQRAKQVPTDKKTLTMQKKPPPPESASSRPRSHVGELARKPISKISSMPASKTASPTHKLSTPPSKSSIYTNKASSSSAMSSTNAKVTSARDRLKNMALAPPQRLNTVKRDMRSVEEIQQDVRRQLGRSVPEERATLQRPKAPERSRVPERMRIPDRRPERSPPSQLQRQPGGRSLSPRPAHRPAANQPRRPPGHMPFRSNRRSRYSDEEDDDLDGFIDDGDEEHDNNNYSDVISKLFRYDRKRYRDEQFSDDDMEVGACDVLREEKRSSRIAKQEDQLEEQREREEMERAHKRKLARLKQRQAS